MYSYLSSSFNVESNDISRTSEGVVGMNVEVRVIVLAVLAANYAWAGLFEVYSLK